METDRHTGKERPKQRGRTDRGEMKTEKQIYTKRETEAERGAEWGERETYRKREEAEREDRKEEEGDR